MDKENPPSEVTIMLNESGWSWNLDWSWTDKKTGQMHSLEKAVRIQNARL